MRHTRGNRARQQRQSSRTSGRSSLRINDLPTEILSRIISTTIDVSGTRSVILSCQLVCRKWKSISDPTLTKHVALTSTACLKVWVKGLQLKDVRFVLLRSLSVFLVTPLPEKCHCEAGCLDPMLAVGQQGINHVARHSSSLDGTKLLGVILSHLPSLLKRTVSLTTFSLRIENAPGSQWCGCYEPSLPMVIFSRILETIPESCVNVEFDTGGIEDNHTRANMRDQLFNRGYGQALPITTIEGAAASCFQESPEHLCNHIRSIVPRLQHLRLRLSHLCPFVLLADAEHSAVAPGAPQPRSATCLTAPGLRTCSINLITCPRKGQPLCFYYSALQHPRLDFTTWLQQREVGLKHLAGVMHHSMLQGNIRLPKIEKFELFHGAQLPKDEVGAGDDELPDSPTEDLCSFSGLSLITCYDILNNRTHHMPFRQFGSIQDVSTYHYRTFGNCVLKDRDDRALVGSLAELENLLERTWATSTLGTRHPVTAFRPEDDVLVRDFDNIYPAIDSPQGNRGGNNRRGHRPSIELGELLDSCDSPTEQVRLLAGVNARTMTHQGFVHFTTSQ